MSHRTDRCHIGSIGAWERFYVGSECFLVVDLENKSRHIVMYKPYCIFQEHLCYITCKYNVLFFPSRVVVMAGDFICLEKQNHGFNPTLFFLLAQQHQFLCQMGRLTRRNSPSDTPALPGVLRRVGTEGLEAPGCRLSSCPANHNQEGKFLLVSSTPKQKREVHIVSLTFDRDV